MKRLVYSVIFTLCSLMQADAQSVPQGMSYQAVLRDAKGDILADADVTLSFQFITSGDRETIWYEENHFVRTNSLGLINLILGGGKSVYGQFDLIPWSSEDVSLRVGLDERGGEDFITLGENKLLSVPYAMHAGTAGQVAEEDDRGLTFGNKYWSVTGNTGTNPSINYLGTPDRKDLVFRTFNTERMRIYSGGGFQMSGNLNLTGDAFIDGVMNLYKNLSVTGDISGNANLQLAGDATVRNMNVNQSLLVMQDITAQHNLNIHNDASIGNELKVAGKTTLAGDLNIAGDLNLAKKLNVAGATTLNNTLNVTDITSLQNELRVYGGTYLHQDLIVNNDAQISGDMDVLGGFTLSGLLYIAGKTNMDGALGIGAPAPTQGMLHVKGSAAEHLALFENTNTGSGDGIAIKLHKQKTRGDNHFLTFYNGAGGIAGRVEGYDVAFDLLEEFPAPTAAVGKELGCLLLRPDNPMMFGLNYAVDNINIIGNLWNDHAVIPGIPIPNVPSLEIPGFSLFGGWDLPSPLPDVPAIGFPTTPVFAGLDIPDVPAFDFSSVIGEIPQVDYVGNYVGNAIGCPTGPFPSAYPNITGWLGDLGTWATNNDMKEMMGTGLTEIAVKSVLWGVMRAAKDGGVTYGSRGADYAEYLERVDGNEKMIQGEIVGVFGGKISKQTAGADQILAISSMPIVLGNQPEADKAEYYEKVGFIGQVPTFVRGHVEVGDYILPSGKNDGIGRAVSADEITVDDLSQVLGKAWSVSSGEGLSLINVSIGLRPTELTTIIKGLENRISNLEASVARLSN